MFRLILLSILIATVVTAAVVRAEKADMSPERLRKTATHVITGRVNAVYTKTATVGTWKYTRYVAEIRVATCEKGDGLEKGGLLYARYWRRAWAGKGHMPPSTTGHRGLPQEGEILRIYLARNAYDGFASDNKDGGFNVIGANGFEKLKRDAAKKKR